MSASFAGSSSGIMRATFAMFTSFAPAISRA
jgi:hypothetical protein